MEVNKEKHSIEDKYLYIKSLSDNLTRPLIFCTARVCACMGCVNGDLIKIGLSEEDYLIEKCKDVGLDIPEVVYLLKSGRVGLSRVSGLFKGDFLLLGDSYMSVLLGDKVVQKIPIDLNLIHYLLYQIKQNGFG